MPHAISIRTSVTLLVVATILPILIFAALLVNRAARNEQGPSIQGHHFLPRKSWAMLSL